ncbi:MAG: 30S ribosomal protein S20 [Chlamydia sp.]
MANPPKGKEIKKVKRPTQQKRQIQNEKQRLINKGIRTRVKTAMKSYAVALSEKNSDTSQNALSLFFSLVDKAAKHGVFKQNKADRMKSKMASKLAA